MMYIFITEDQEIYKSDVITKDDIWGSDAGVLTIINTETVKIYDGGNWIEPEEYPKF